MRAVLERLSIGYEELEGSAEAIPLTDASVEAVFCAEAFHWFDPVSSEVSPVRPPLRTSNPSRPIFRCSYSDLPIFLQRFTCTGSVLEVPVIPAAEQQAPGTVAAAGPEEASAEGVVRSSPTTSIPRDAAR
jgi:hypothetical protein